MQSEVRTYLFDIASAISAIEDFTAGRSLEEYEQDLMLRSAVERQFGIVGEAMARVGQRDPDLPPGSATNARSSTSVMSSSTSTSGYVTQPFGAWSRTVCQTSAVTLKPSSTRSSTHPLRVEHDLAEEGGGLHQLVRLRDVAQREPRVDDRVDRALLEHVR